MSKTKKYRILQEGETILSTDECDASRDIHSPAKWVPAGRTAGQKAPSPLYPSHRKYRREISSKKPSPTAKKTK